MNSNMRDARDIFCTFCNITILHPIYSIFFGDNHYIQLIRNTEIGADMTKNIIFTGTIAC